MTNPDGGFADSSGRLQIREEAPTINAVGPLTDADGRRKETLSTTLNGTNFLAGPTVSFGANIADPSC